MILKAIYVIFLVSIFTLPSNLAKTWRVPSAYSNGIFYEYWAPKVYLSQILIFLTIILLHYYKRKKNNDIRTFLKSTAQKAKNRLLTCKAELLIIIILILNALSVHATTSLPWIFGVFFGPFLLYTLIKEPFLKKKLPFALLLTSLFQALLGIWQYVSQNNMFPYHILGETQFHSPLGLARSTFLSNSMILPYGTTPHPNILAAWMICGLLALVVLRKKTNKKSYSFLAAPLLITLLLTESVSAWLTLPMLILLAWKKSVFDKTQVLLIGILLSVVVWTAFPFALESLYLPEEAPLSLTRRTIPLKEFAKNMAPYLLTGSGIMQSFPILSASEQPTLAWKYPQPLHHSGIILVTELGFCAFLLLFILLIFDQKNYSNRKWAILLFLPVFYLDHYILTNVLGQYVAILLIVFFDSITKYNES